MNKENKNELRAAVTKIVATPLEYDGEDIGIDVKAAEKIDKIMAILEQEITAATERARIDELERMPELFFGTAIDDGQEGDVVEVDLDVRAIVEAAMNFVNYRKKRIKDLSDKEQGNE